MHCIWLMSSVLNNSWRITATGDPHECNRLLRFSGFVPNRPFAWHVSRFWKYTRRIQNQMDTWYPCSDYIWAPNNWLVITLHSCVECNLYLIRCNEAREAYLSTLSNPQAKISAYTGPIDSAKCEIPDAQGNCSITWFTDMFSVRKANNNNARTQSPPPRRPMTTNVVARRLVHNALGVRSPVRTPEQRKAEEEMLKNARGTLPSFSRVCTDSHWHNLQ